MIQNHLHTRRSFGKNSRDILDLRFFFNQLVIIEKCLIYIVTNIVYGLKIKQ